MTYLSGMTTLSSLGEGIFELGSRDDGDGLDLLTDLGHADSSLQRRRFCRNQTFCPSLDLESREA